MIPPPRKQIPSGATKSVWVKCSRCPILRCVAFGYNVENVTHATRIAAMKAMGWKYAPAPICLSCWCPFSIQEKIAFRNSMLDKEIREAHFDNIRSKLVEKYGEAAGEWCDAELKQIKLNKADQIK